MKVSEPQWSPGTCRDERRRSGWGRSGGAERGSRRRLGGCARGRTRYSRARVLSPKPRPEEPEDSPLPAYEELRSGAAGAPSLTCREKARQRWWRRSRRGVQRAPSLCPAHLPTAAAGACGFRGGRGPRQMTHAIAAAGQLEGFHGGAGGAHTVEHRGGIRGAHTVEYRARAAKGTGRLQLASLARAHLCRGRVRVGQVAHAAQDGGLVRHERDLAA